MFLLFSCMLLVKFVLLTKNASLLGKKSWLRISIIVQATAVIVITFAYLDLALELLLLELVRPTVFRWSVVVITATTLLVDYNLLMHNQEIAASIKRRQETNRRAALLDKQMIEFVQNVSHEFRHPLQLVIGYVDHLVGGGEGELPESAELAMGKVALGARRLNHMVSRMVVYLQPMNVTAFDLPSLIDEVIVSDELWSGTGKIPDSLIVVDRSERPLGIQADRQKLLFMIVELLNNAIKFSKPTAESVLIRAYKSRGQVVLIVEDHGEGIEEAYRERIFRLFSQANGTARRRHGGMGMGLAICKNIVQSHNGKIDFQSDVGQGTTFTVTLPLIQPEAAVVQ